METLQIQQKEIITKGKIQIIEFMVKRNSLFVKSPVLEEFFKESSIGLNVRSNVHDETFDVYKCPTIDNKDRNSLYYDNLDSFVNQEGYINATFLRVKGISEGKHFKISGVNSKEQVKKFKEEFTRISNDLYKEYVKPISAKVEIWTTNEGNV